MTAVQDPTVAPRTATTTCPLCEASCGLEVTIGAHEIKVRGDRDDVLSGGFLCPKGASLGALHSDPDRLRTPLVRHRGELVEASWDDAFGEIDRRLTPLIAAHGRNAVAVYFGNPTAHQLAASLYLRPLIQTLGSPNVFSAGTVDHVPKVFVAGYMYGDAATVPVPDLDRTEHLLVIGADPLVSNGSLMTAPDMPRRLARIAERGKVVVIDPRRTRTAKAATEHVAIRPGTDALLLAAMLHTILAEGLVDLGTAAAHVSDPAALDDLVADFTPEAVAGHTGIAPETTRRLARELAAADRAVVYGRLGTTAQAFGTLTSWLIDVLNIVTGNLDRPGGIMFPLAAAGQANARPGTRRPFRHGRWHSRVSGRPEVMGELPMVTFAEEALTPGPGQVRGLITISGNPCLSAPNSARIAEAFEAVEFQLSLDVYLNETTRHADVVLPGPTPLERSHYDLLLYQYAVRNVANYSPPVIDTGLDTGMYSEWETMLRLIGILRGEGPSVDTAVLDDAIAFALGEVNGVRPDSTLRGPERLLDVLLRSGPYALSLAELEARPHGLDLGELAPRLPGVLATGSGQVELCPEAVVSDLPRLRGALAEAPYQGMVLVGRRHVRSNNSWMHNVANLNRAGNDCTAQLHPQDAAALELTSGDRACLTSRVGTIEIEVEVSEDVGRGVVSLPHGWGHDVAGSQLAVAAGRPGVNTNLLSDDARIDEPTGTVAVSGIPVTVRAALLPRGAGE